MTQSYQSFRIPQGFQCMSPRGLLLWGLGQHTNRIGLLGASVTQHPEFDALLAHLLQPQYRGVRLR